MEAAAEIAAALCQADNRAMLSLAVPEANSLGQAMLCGPDAPTLNQLSKRAAAGKLQTLVIVENDLYRRGPAETIDALLANVANVIVMDALDNPTLSASSLALPAASFAESEGTLVSMEGRAQRYYPVFVPRQERRASWIWLLACMKESEREDVARLHHFDDITRACASDVAALAGITGAAPDHHFRNVGLKVPRQTHRYSGRTAMRADVSVHEPKAPVDEESPLAFSMEGLNRSQPGSLLPYVWAPGWNSNQALHKFQAEVGGPLKGGTAGARLLLPATASRNSTASQPVSIPNNTRVQQPGQWLMVARYKIFGSDELSAHSPAIAELVEPGFIEISGDDARALGVIEGDGLVLSKPETTSQGDMLTVPVATLEVRLNDSLAKGCAGYSVGLEGAQNIVCGDSLAMVKADNWQRHKPQIIGSDGGGHV
jgi:NADH-quinone oxidoreductase subunit G